MIIEKNIMSVDFKYDTDTGVLYKMNKKKMIYESIMNRAKDKYNQIRFHLFDESGQQRGLTYSKVVKKMYDDDFDLTYGFRV